MVEEAVTLHLRSSLDGAALGFYQAAPSAPVAHVAEEAVRLAEKSNCIAKLMLTGCDQPLEPNGPFLPLPSSYSATMTTERATLS